MPTEYLSCKQAARLLDVSPSTIKRLCDERRLESLRTPGGHRRISLKSIQQCQDSVGITEAHGWTSKRDANLSLDYHEFAQKLLVADESELAKSVTRFRQRYRVIELCDMVFAPAMVHLSASHLRGEIQLHQLIIAMQSVRRVLYDLRRLQPAVSASAPQAVGAHVAGDPSDLASLMIELALRELGWHARSLGSDVDSRTLAQAASEVDAALVWVCYVHHQPQEQLVQQNRLLREQMPSNARLVIGGGALTAQLRRSLSFHFFGDSLAQLREFLSGAGNAAAA